MFNQLDKKITGLLMQIKDKKITPAESNVGVLINRMKTIDEPAYDKHLAKYKGLLEELKK